MGRVVVVGLDGATWRVIHPLAQAGHLPTLRTLLQEGAWAVLRSVTPPLSPPAWTTFMTGANPGKTRIYDFIGRRQDGRFYLVNGGWRALPSLWQLLSDAGYRVAVVNVPMTYPPEPVNGVLISGMDAPVKDRAVGYPADIHARVRQAGFAYRVDVPHSRLWPQSPDRYLGTYVQAVNELALVHASVARWLWDAEQPDFLMVTLVHTDRVSHAAGRQLKDITPEQIPHLPADHPIVSAYRTADIALAMLLEVLPKDTTLLVVSDHGFRPYDQVLNLNRWLYETGWLDLDEAALRPAAWRTWLAPVWQRVQYRLWRRRGVDLMQRSPFFRAIRWHRTRAYTFGAFGSIYINLQGRDPFGIVPPAMYDQVCEALTAELLALRDPLTGHPVIRHVWRASEVYNGPFVHLGPDLLLDLAPGYFVRNALDEYRPELFYPAGRYGTRALEHTGMHDPEGILLVWGHRVSAQGEQPPVHIMDIMPTVLALFDVPIPPYVDGHPLTRWCDITPRFAKTAEEHRAGDAGAEYDVQESELIIKRLRELGYL